MKKLALIVLALVLAACAASPAYAAYASEAVAVWNASPRMQSDLISLEARIRELLEEAETTYLTPLFEPIRPLLVKTLEAYLASVFGVVDRNDAHRVANGYEFIELDRQVRLLVQDQMGERVYLCRWFQK